MKISTFSVGDQYPGHGRTTEQLYQQLTEQAVLADELGFEAVWFAEHHFDNYGIVPNPAVLLASIAARTKRVKLGSAVSILPLHDPRTVAENYAMVDILSNGRLVFGVGSGYVETEFNGYSIPISERRDRFDESVGLVGPLLRGEQVEHAGRFHRIDNVTLNVRATQIKPPIFLAIGRREAAFQTGRSGFNLMFNAYTLCQQIDDAGPIIADFRKGAAQAVGGPLDSTAATALHTHVAETDEVAREHAGRALDLYVQPRVRAKKKDYDEAVAAGIVLFGSVETVAAQLVKMHHLGIDHVLTVQNFGLLPPHLVEASMRRLMTEVMPLVHERIAGLAVA
jgi:alkanesulfonate monooxygenase SsuD/methylene tetrahydromethanopterin reductase-like flavin-dependent oxidoreductase (luciferase family)